MNLVKPLTQINLVVIIESMMQTGYVLLKSKLPLLSISNASDKELTCICRYIQCKCVHVTSDHTPIKVAWSHNSNSGIDERAIDESNLCYNWKILGQVFFHIITV